MKNKVLENISFVIVAITLILIAVFSENGKMMLYIASGGLIISGILSCIMKNRHGAMILGGGLSLLTTMFIYTNEILDKVDSTTFFVCLTLILISVISYVFMVINEKDINKKYNMEVEAEIIDLEKNPNTKKEYYRPVYKYYLDNGEYKVALPYFLDKNFPKVGDKVKIKVDSNDHADVYFERKLLDKIYYWGTGAVLIIAAVGILISLFK